MTLKEKIEKEIRIHREILDSPIESHNKRSFLEGRLEGLEVALNLLKGTFGDCSKLSDHS